MTQRHKIFFLLLILAVLILPGLLAAAPSACRSEAGGHCVNLAGVHYAQIEQFLQDATPGDLIPRLFTFGLGLVGLSALIMLVFGGLTYMTARDSADQIKRAQGYMTNAIFGLGLAFLSWLILFTINPDLVRGLDLGSDKIKKLTPEATSQNAGTGSGVRPDEFLRSNCATDFRGLKGVPLDQVVTCRVETSGFYFCDAGKVSLDQCSAACKRLSGGRECEIPKN